ncbi:MAG: HAMP domain-containing histidine kinase [Clostridiales bacterium]|jgi:signal transduction histidine kinase|nr:HAMP domain-containing histidine kinase [Clostridiales bacterium]
MKTKPYLQTLTSVAFFVAVFLVCNVFSFGLIFELLYDKLTELSIQIIASVVSLLLTILILTVTRFSLLKRYKDAFIKTAEVIKRLTKGDFDVPPAGDFRIDPKLGGFVKSIDIMASELAKVEKMRREFVSNVSHEIQSPLTNIRGYAKALEKADSTEQREYIDVIQSESERLSNLSENLLRLASLDAETMLQDVAPCRLDRQIRSVILACEPQWTSKNIDPQAELEELTVPVNVDLLAHVWTNLLANAIKFTPVGGQIYVSLSQQGENAVCQIDNTGIGIEADALPHIFERFYKADKSRELFKGSGLGLAIAKKIVELHNGTIKAQSRAGEGASFIVSLPLH